MGREHYRVALLVVVVSGRGSWGGRPYLLSCRRALVRDHDQLQAWLGHRPSRLHRAHLSGMAIVNGIGCRIGCRGLGDCANGCAVLWVYRLAHGLHVVRDGCLARGSGRAVARYLTLLSCMELCVGLGSDCRDEQIKPLAGFGCQDRRHSALPNLVIHIMVQRSSIWEQKSENIKIIVFKIIQLF